MTRIASFVFALCATSGAALAQAQGSFPATLVCDAPGGVRERASFALALEGDGRASYSVRLGARGTESGTGRLEGRTLSLVGAAPGPAGYAARYSGAVSGRGGLLTGTQTPKAGASRACQIVLGDG